MAALTAAEYHVLDDIIGSFASDWYDEKFGNLLWKGTNGEGARTVEDAFAAWKLRGGKWNCSGLSRKFNRDKAITFAEIVADYNIKQKAKT